MLKIKGAKIGKGRAHPNPPGRRASLHTKPAYLTIFSVLKVLRIESS